MISLVKNLSGIGGATAPDTPSPSSCGTQKVPWRVYKARNTLVLVSICPSVVFSWCWWHSSQGHDSQFIKMVIYRAILARTHIYQDILFVSSVQWSFLNFLVFQRFRRFKINLAALLAPRRFYAPDSTKFVDFTQYILALLFFTLSTHVCWSSQFPKSAISLTKNQGW